MRVAFNATALLSPLTGIGQYAFHLAEGLSRLPEVNLEYFYGAYWRSELNRSDNVVTKTALPWLRNHLPFAYELRRSVQNNRFGRHARKAGFDLYHEPNILPLKFSGPTVLTVHDISWLRYPETHPVERVRAMNRYFEQGLRQASAIITDAEFVKQELMERFAIGGERITAIPLGVEQLFHPQEREQVQSSIRPHNLTYGKYFLAAGTLEPRKNLVTALTAFGQLPQRTQEEFPLVLVGMSGWGNAALEVQIKPLLRSGVVRQLGYVPRANLAALMSGARSLLYPSIYEGFGLPPLEAMACGTPVICSNASSLPEVVAGAGVMVDALDHDAIMLAMRKMVEDEDHWQALRRMSVIQASRFTWENTARETLAVYRSALH